MNKNIKHLFSVFLVLAIAISSYAQNNNSAKGKLFLIGGGKKPITLIEDMVRTADLYTSDHIVVLPMANDQPDSAYQSIKKQLNEVCDNEVVNLNFDSLSVNNSTMLYQLLTAKLIYIPGGSQTRFMNVIRNTRVYDYIHKAFQNGATIAGTSAGAAVMSKYMITGKELLGENTYKPTFDKLWKNNIEFTDGLGLLDSVIIDQHFIKRSRYNRLLSALDAKPDFDCIGIDESTVLMVDGRDATIFGESQVLRFSDVENGNGDGTSKLIKFRDVRFSVFIAGDRFIIK